MKCESCSRKFSNKLKNNSKFKENIYTLLTTLKGKKEHKKPPEKK